jgi:hypothetical protein
LPEKNPSFIYESYSHAGKRETIALPREHKPLKRERTPAHCLAATAKMPILDIYDVKEI